MKKQIAILKGDGIGPEIVAEAIKVIRKVGPLYNVEIETVEGLIGGHAVDVTGDPLPRETVEICKKADAILLGAVGSPKYDDLPSDKRPEKGLLAIRKELGLYANIRPALLVPALKEACPLRRDIADKGINITMVRELNGGIYFGEKGRDKERAYDIDAYSVEEIKRIAKVAFEAAKKSKGKLTSIDKSNVLENSKLWKEVVTEMASEYPEVELSHMLVDNAAMQLIKEPSQFDVVLANNMFGDILSDEAAMITGSIGILPSSSMGDTTQGLYEPIHGSAPDIAGQNIANPIATILSVAMMFRYSFGKEEAAQSIENAVYQTLEAGYMTADLNSKKYIKCDEMGNLICQKII